MKLPKQIKNRQIEKKNNLFSTFEVYHKNKTIDRSNLKYQSNLDVTHIAKINL